MEGEPRPISGEVRLSGESLGPTRTTMFFKEQIHIHTTGMSVQIETLKMHIFLIKLVSVMLTYPCVAFAVLFHTHSVYFTIAFRRI